MEKRLVGRFPNLRAIAEIKIPVAPAAHSWYPVRSEKSVNVILNSVMMGIAIEERRGPTLYQC
jgi:hypothetical protein